MQTLKIISSVLFLAFMFSSCTDEEIKISDLQVSDNSSLFKL